MLKSQSEDNVQIQVRGRCLCCKVFICSASSVDRSLKDSVTVLNITSSVFLIPGYSQLHFHPSPASSQLSKMIWFQHLFVYFTYFRLLRLPLLLFLILIYLSVEVRDVRDVLVFISFAAAFSSFFLPQCSRTVHTESKRLQNLGGHVCVQQQRFTTVHTHTVLVNAIITTDGHRPQECVHSGVCYCDPESFSTHKKFYFLSPELLLADGR